MKIVVSLMILDQTPSHCYEFILLCKFGFKIKLLFLCLILVHHIPVHFKNQIFVFMYFFFLSVLFLVCCVVLCSKIDSVLQSFQSRHKETENDKLWKDMLPLLQSLSVHSSDRFLRFESKACAQMLTLTAMIRHMLVQPGDVLDSTYNVIVGKKVIIHSLKRESAAILFNTQNSDFLPGALAINQMSSNIIMMLWFPFNISFNIDQVLLVIYEGCIQNQDGDSSRSLSELVSRGDKKVNFTPQLHHCLPRIKTRINKKFLKNIINIEKYLTRTVARFPENIKYRDMILQLFMIWHELFSHCDGPYKLKKMLYSDFMVRVINNTFSKIQVSGQIECLLEPLYECVISGQPSLINLKSSSASSFLDIPMFNIIGGVCMFFKTENHKNGWLLIADQTALPILCKVFTKQLRDQFSDRIQATLKPINKTLRDTMQNFIINHILPHVPFSNISSN